MNSVIMILLLTILQFAAGFGLLSLFKIIFRPGIFIPLAIITGIGIFSVIPFILQLIYIPLTVTSVFSVIFAVVIVLNIKFRQAIFRFNQIWKYSRFRIRLYEVPSLLLICFLVFVSVWRCFYYPPFPRDLTSGAEVIAEYTTREKSMVNSVFSVNLESTNNQFKPPYITSLQVIYKYAGLPFGQVWLSTIFISFLIFLFHVMIIRLHRLIAGLLLVFFIAIPEMYAYTFMALYDYSNAVFFCLAVFFLLEFFEYGQKNNIILAGIMMGFATYSRSETLVLACFLLPALLWYHIKNWDGFKKILGTTFLFMTPSFIFYVVPVIIYINLYLPVSYPLQGLVNNQLFNPLPFIERFIDMNSQLIFSETGINYYGYFNFFFFLVLLLDLVLTDKWANCSKNWLYVIAVVFLGLPFLGFLLPLFDLDHSTKRGLFKIFPLMLMYMGCSGVLNELSEIIRKWEKN